MKMKKLLALTLCVMMMLSCFSMFTATAAPQIKNIIYMIPDGGGYVPFGLADAVKQAGGVNSKFPNSTPQTVNEMYLKDYLVGAETTYSNNQAVTDSAAAGTALATGKKTNNYFIGINPARKPIATILEAAQYVGKRAGLVSTYPWSHATPASFSSHAEDRYYYRTIAQQMINQGLDVVLPMNATAAGAYDEAATDIAAHGYSSVTSVDQMLALESGAKVWGTLGGDFAFSNRDIYNAASYPNLAEMTTAAIQALEGSDEGFFLMVEGSAVDGGGHASNGLDMVTEFIAFDEACKVAIEYAKGRTDTVVVVASDHDTGGMNVLNQATAISNIQNGIIPGTSVMTWDGNGSHTARNCGVFAYVPSGVAGIPGSAPTPGVSTNFNNYVFDNTAITPWLADLIGVDLDEMTSKLFVDVSSIGTYTPVSDTYWDYDDSVSVTTSAHTGTFTFKDYDLTVERNTSKATYNGETIDLDGQVCVYAGGRFYVPQLLLDTVGIEFDPSDVETASSILVGADLANSVQGNSGVTIGSSSVTIQQNSYTTAYVTFQIGVPKTAYYNVQAMIDTSNRLQYGNVLYGTGLTGEFDNGESIKFAAGRLSDPEYWTDDSSDSVLLEEGNHTITFTSGDGANNIIFLGLQLVEDLSKDVEGDATPTATPTPTPASTPTPPPDYGEISYIDAPYAGVYEVTSDKAVTLTNETGHTITLEAGATDYFYLIKGNNNVTLSDATATLTFTALAGNGMDYVSEIAAEVPLTSDRYYYGRTSDGETVGSYVISKDDSVTVAADNTTITLPAGASVVVNAPIPADNAGIYTLGIRLNDSAINTIRMETDTGYYGEIQQIAGYDFDELHTGTVNDAQVDVEQVYLREGDNHITITNKGTSNAVVEAYRVYKTAQLATLTQYNWALSYEYFKVVGGKETTPSATPTPTPTATPTPTPTATPTPTPASTPTPPPDYGEISYTDAPYAGVYEVTSDKAVTLTNETGHTVTLEAGATDYFYLIKGNNNVTLSDATATLTFTALAGNGMDYVSEVAAEVPLTSDRYYYGRTSDGETVGSYVISKDDSVTVAADNTTITLPAGASVVVNAPIPADNAGIYTLGIRLNDSAINTIRMETDTGYYGEIQQIAGADFDELHTGTVNDAQVDVEQVYLREGDNHITITNKGTSNAVVEAYRVYKTAQLATLTQYNWALSYEYFKVVGGEESTPSATPTPTPTATPDLDTVTYDAPYAGVYKASSDKAVTLINETGHKVTLSAGGTGYYYMFKGTNTMTTTDTSANVTFTALSNNGMDYINNVTVTETPLTSEHVYLGFDEYKDGGIWNIVNFVYEAPEGLTYGNRTITIPGNSEVVLFTPDHTAAGLYYMAIKTDVSVTNLRIETSTGYYGVWQSTYAGGTTFYEDNDINGNGTRLLYVYLKEGRNYITVINNDSKAFTTDGLRPSRTTSVTYTPLTAMSSCRVIVDEDIVIPTPTPEATPTPTPTPVPDGVTSYTAPYAGVYAISADAATTVTSEIGSTVTLAAGETKYIYLLKGENILTNSENASLTFTGFVNNGLEYLDQVTADIPLAPSSISELVLSGNYVNPRGSVTDYGAATGVAINTNASVDVQLTAPAAGLYIVQIQFAGDQQSSVRVSTDTGFYGIINQQAGRSGWNELYQGTHGVGNQDLEILFLREGVNTITFENIGDDIPLITKVKLAKTGTLASLEAYNWQLNVDNLKVIVDEHKYTDFALDTETATASVNLTKGNEADEVVSLIIAEYDEATGKLLQVNIEYIDTSLQAFGTTEGYSASLTGVTGALKAMLINDNLVPYFNVAE